MNGRVVWSAIYGLSGEVLIEVDREYNSDKCRIPFRELLALQARENRHVVKYAERFSRAFCSITVYRNLPSQRIGLLDGSYFAACNAALNNYATIGRVRKVTYAYVHHAKLLLGCVFRSLTDCQRIRKIQLWRCEQKLRCKARADSIGGMFVSALNVPCHDSDLACKLFWKKWSLKWNAEMNAALMRTLKEFRRL